MNQQLSDNECRIITDVFFSGINRKKLSKEGYRDYLWQQWQNLWKNKETPYDNMVGTKEEFMKTLHNSI